MNRRGFLQAAAAAGAAPAASRPNILLFCTDQQRFDTIRALGNPHIRTPNLDRLVGAGVAFTNAYCQTPICTASRASLTGCYASTLHVNRNGNEYLPAAHAPTADFAHAEGRRLRLRAGGQVPLSSASKRVEPRLDDGYRLFEWSHAPRERLARRAAGVYALAARPRRGLRKA